MPQQWIVLLEATDAGGPGVVDQDDFARLLAALDRNCVGQGGALHSSDRYALQLITTASGPAEALSGVLSGWANALLELDLPSWEVVRTEVLTSAELARDHWNHVNDMPALAAASAKLRRQRCSHLS